MSKVCLIIPCYNEASRLNTAAFENFLLTERNYAICFVDDGSDDKTVSLLQVLQTKFPGQIFLIRMDINAGKAEAIRKGVSKMYSNGRFDYLGYFDADLSTPLSVAINFVRLLQRNDQLQIIFGSRRLVKETSIKKNYLRHLVGRCFSFFINYYFTISLYDTQCGAKVFRSKIVPIVFERKFISRWLFDIEIILRLRNICGNDNTVKEIPVKEWVNKRGSKIRFIDLLRLPTEMRAIKKSMKNLE
ncbi:MAG TPA: glycosyltransferase [Chitinophagaceae bacterium]|nr:glycosyltransferase [Chitinophagaceae bacterium]